MCRLTCRLSSKIMRVTLYSNQDNQNRLRVFGKRLFIMLTVQSDVHPTVLAASLGRLPLDAFEIPLQDLALKNL